MSCKAIIVLMLMFLYAEKIQTGLALRTNSSTFPLHSPILLHDHTCEKNLHPAIAFTSWHAFYFCFLYKESHTHQWIYSSESEPLLQTSP